MTIRISISRVVMSAAVGVMVFALGCTRSSDEIPKDTLAVVNGVPITSVDIDIALQRGKASGADITQAQRRGALESLIRQELIRQKALALGLDKKPAEAEKLRAIKARYLAVQRAELSDAYFKYEVVQEAVPTEAEARKYFDANADRLGTEYRLKRILTKDENLIREAKAEIEGGKPFVDLASEINPVHPTASPTPGDMGFLRWSQLPAAWRETVEKLDIGEVSDVIASGKRFWILKLEARRQSEKLDFETERAPIMEMLQAERMRVLRQEKLATLYNEANISYLK